MIELSEQQIIEQLTQRLADAHTSVERAQIAEIVRTHHSRFEGRPIRDFIPLFVERNAKADLGRLGV